MVAKTTQFDFLEFLKGQKLVEGVQDSELIVASPFFELLCFEPGDVVFHEGETSKDLYVIVEGAVALLKEDEAKQTPITIGKLGRGDIFGEMSFVDDSPRSCTIKAFRPLILIKLSKSALEESPLHVQEVYRKLLRNITRIIVERLRETNAIFIKQKSIEIKKLMSFSEFGNLLLTLIASCLLLGNISGFLFQYGGFKEYYSELNLLAAILMLLPIYKFVRDHDYSWSKFGLHGWKTIALGRVLTFSILAVASVAVAVYILKAFMPTSNEIRLSIFEWLILPFYIFCLEFIFRGTLQTVLTKFTSNNSPTWANIFTALLVASTNFYFDITTPLLAFLINIFCGWVYMRENNLLLSTLMHMALVIILKYGGLLNFANFT